MQSQNSQPINNEAIDIYLRDIFRAMPENYKNICHIFNPFFFENLLACDTEAYINTPGFNKRKFNLLNHHLRNLNVTQKNFIFVPWKQSDSWFLIVVCLPGKQVKLDEPLILYYDSRKSNENTNYGQISTKMRLFLCYAFWRKTGQQHDFSTVKANRIRPIPYHENIQDSALYMLQYIESFMESIDANGKMLPMIGLKHWFSDEVIIQKKKRLQNLPLCETKIENIEQVKSNVTTVCKYCNNKNNNTDVCLKCKRKLNKENRVCKLRVTPFIDNRHHKKKVPVHKLETSDESPVILKPVVSNPNETRERLRQNIRTYMNKVPVHKLETSDESPVILKPVVSNPNETRERLRQNIRTYMNKRKSMDESKVDDSQFIEIQAECSDLEVPDNELLTFPPHPKTGGILLTTVDYLGLGDEQLINDAIIEFYLKYLMLRVFSAKDRDRTHVFGTYFFYTLSRKLSQNFEDNLTEEQKLHNKVKKWTKDVNIFEKDFVIIPIHDCVHWFVVILCFHGQTNNHSLKDESKVKKEPIKKPCMLIFDSLSGNWTSKMSNTLRSYLNVEYRIKMGKNRKFSVLTFPEIHPQVMKQDNATDCGLFLLQFVESFFQNPIKNFTPPIKLKNWFQVEAIAEKRKIISDTILMLMKEQNITHIKLPHIKISVRDRETEDDKDKQEAESSETNNKIKPRDKHQSKAVGGESEESMDNSKSKVSTKKRKLDECKGESLSSSKMEKRKAGAELSKSNIVKSPLSRSQRLSDTLKKDWECDESPVGSQETNTKKKVTTPLQNPYIALVDINKGETSFTRNTLRSSNKNNIVVPIAMPASEYSSDENSDVDSALCEDKYILPIAVPASDSSSESASEKSETSSKIFTTKPVAASESSTSGISESSSQFFTTKPVAASESPTTVESVSSKSESASNKKKKVISKKRHKK